MNVIVVVCNGLHLGFLGPYGNGWVDTPNLDRLAAEGVVFDHHYPENLTTIPTRRSWWTGRYGFADPGQGWTPLRTDEVILPDRLASQGVRTALISDVPMLRATDYGFGRGWDDVTWVRGSGYDPYIPAGDPRGGKARIEDEPGLRLPEEDDPDFELWKGRWEQFLRNRSALKSREAGENTGAARTVRAAVDWLERRGDDPEPFLLWVDVFSPHGPWDPPEAYRDRYAAEEPDEFEAGDEGDLVEEDDGEEIDLEQVPVLIDVPAGAVGDVLDESELLRLRRTYAGAVTLVDHWLGELFASLKRLGRDKDTLIVFTGDQGEPLGEHGFVRRFRPWLYEELIHTPLIVRMPKGEPVRGWIASAGDCSDRGSSPDDPRGSRAPPEADSAPRPRPASRSIRGERTKVPRLCVPRDGHGRVRDPNSPQWHLTLPIEVDPDDPPRFPELYRKPEDRWDQNDVAGLYPEVAEHLELTLRRFAELLGRDALDVPPSLREIARFSPPD